MSSNMKIQKICGHCGQQFIARTTVTKYCGDNCAKRAYKARVREEKIKKSQIEIEKSNDVSTARVNDKSYFSLKTLDYLTVKEAADLLKCDPRTIYRLVKRGCIPSANLSIRRIRILKKDIDSLFIIPDNNDQSITIDQKEILETPLEDCFTIGEIQNEYCLSETSLRSLITRHKIPKFQRGKFVYIPKKIIEPILLKIHKNQYCG